MGTSAGTIIQIVDLPKKIRSSIQSYKHRIYRTKPIEAYRSVADVEMGTADLRELTIIAYVCKMPITL